jgi:hypothetical protein
MSKQTFKKTRENENRRRYQFEGYLKLTKAYQHFLEKHSEAVRKEIEDHIAFQKKLDQKQKGNDEFDPESLWVFRFYCWSPEAERVKAELSRRMGYAPTQLAVRPISDAGYFMTMDDGKVNPEGAPILKDGRFLTIELDLSESKEVIKQQIDFFLDAHYPQVKRIPKKRGGKLLKPEEFNKMIHAYKLVDESGSATEAAREIFSSEIKTYQNPAKSRITQVGRWHDIVKSRIEDL